MAAINISYTGKCKTRSGHLTKRCPRKGVEQLFYRVCSTDNCDNDCNEDPITKRKFLLIKVVLPTSLIEWKLVKLLDPIASETKT